MPRFEETGVTRPAPAIALAVVGVAMLSACAGTSSQATDVMPPDADEAMTSEAAGNGDADVGEGVEEPDPDPVPALTQEQMSEALLAPVDLPGPPDARDTKSGLSWFAEEIAFADDTYTQNFGAGECAAAMDTINPDLTGADLEAAGAQAGLLQEYQRSPEGDDGGSLRLYVWMLSYEEPVDSSGVWSAMLSACDGQTLEGDRDSVSFQALEHERFTGIGLRIDGADGTEVPVFSATYDYGHNLVMVSTVNFDEQTFMERLDLQAEKLDGYAEALSE